jgi:hypothetical protein
MMNHYDRDDDHETNCRASIEQLLDQNLPSQPAEVRDYLSSYLADYVVEQNVPAKDDSASSSREDESLVLHDTLTQLLDGQPGVNQSVLDILVAAMQAMVSKGPYCQGSSGDGSNNNNNNSHHGSQASCASTPLLSLASVSMSQQPAAVTDDERQSTRKELRRDRLRRTKKRNVNDTGKVSRHDASDKREDDGNDGDNDEDDPLDKDHASAWNECQAKGVSWGGRGQGGRGIRSTENKQSIHLPNVTLQFAGNELLTDSPMDIVQGHRYGLIGRNGVGKSTLFQQLARRAIPGLPRDLRIVLVQQHQQQHIITTKTKNGTNESQPQSALEVLLQADTDRLELLHEQEQLERRMEDAAETDESASSMDLEEKAQRLSDVVAELDAIDAEGAPDRAMTILKGLSFTKDMIHGPTSNFRGGGA